MTRLMFVVPAAGRLQLAKICLRQLKRTCEALAEHGIHASAVVVANDQNFNTARGLGFGTVIRDNSFLARKFNDGIQLACDPRYNPAPADYVVPCGSDDWVDHRLFLDLPQGDTVGAFRFAAFVNEDGTEIVSRRIDYQAGVGVRIYPAALMEACAYRPADEDRERGCDTSILVNVTRAVPDLQIRYADLHEFQIVDWKSPGEQLNSYQDITARHLKGTQPADPFETLAGTFPDQALAEMRAHYAQVTNRRVLA